MERSRASIGHIAETDGGHWSTTLAFGANRHEGESSPAYSLETTRLFVRAEHLSNDHLVDSGPLAGEEFDVGKLSLGGAYRIGSAGRLAFDAGALVSGYRILRELESEYGSGPVSGIVSLRTSID